jgi:hypothetical protein
MTDDSCTRFSVAVLLLSSGIRHVSAVLDFAKFAAYKLAARAAGVPR